MTTDDKVDEIDWLISEMRPGAEVESCHICLLEAFDIECRHKRLSKSSSELLIEMLKNVRATLA